MMSYENITQASTPWGWLQSETHGEEKNTETTEYVKK